MKNRFYKVLSIMMTLLMVFSVCSCLIGIVSAAETVTYYVKASGSDSAEGLTEATAFKTVSKAIAKANDAGLGEGDTVNLMVCEYPEVSWGTGRNYSFNLVLESNDPDLRSWVSMSDGFKFGGNTSFKNMKITPITTVYYNNHSISVDEKCTFMATNVYLGSSASSTSTKPINVTLGHFVSSKNIRLTDKNASKIYKEDVTFIVDNDLSTPTVQLASESGTTTFEKNLNISIANSKTISFAKSGGDTDVKGALQVVVNSNIEILKEDKAALGGVNTTGGFYYITNATRVDDILNFTETAGTYTISDERYSVKAKDADDNEYVSENGVLVLPKPGEYVLTVKKEIENPVYYVSSEKGSDDNDGLSAETPKQAINEVIRAAVEAGYWEGDTVTVNVIDNINWTNEYELKSNSTEFDYTKPIVEN